jgi:hypothetical protein
MSGPLIFKIPKIVDDSDCILIENDNIQIEWDANKKNIINSFSPFRKLINKKRN